MFEWDETDFLTVLEVEPQIEEPGLSYLFAVEKAGLRLEMCVFPYEGDVSIILYQSGVERPVLRLRLVECLGARRVKDNRGEFLEIADAQSFGGRYQAEAAVPFGMRVWVNPSIQIELI